MESIESEDEPSSSQENDAHAQAKKQTQEIFKRIEQDREEYGHPPEAFEISNIYESQEVNLEVSSKEGVQKYLSHQMMLFHFNYDFETDTIMTDENGSIPEFPFEEYRPTEDEVYYYIKYVVLSGKMEKEIPLFALVYIE